MFPGVRIQRDLKNIEDICACAAHASACRTSGTATTSRASRGARVAERRLEEFCTKYGKDTVRQFIRSWFDYSERRMIDNIRRMPKAKLVNKGRSDPSRASCPPDWS